MQALIKKDDLSIIVTTPGEWETPGEFRLKDYAVIQIEVPEDMDLVSVQSVGVPMPHGDGLIYIGAEVTLAEIEVL